MTGDKGLSRVYHDTRGSVVLPSMTRNPDPAVNNKINTSNAVTHTPAINGQPKSSFSATALPITSAKSHAVMAISCDIHNTVTTYLG